MILSITTQKLQVMIIIVRIITAMMIITMMKKISGINFISEAKENITKRCKRKPTIDNKFGDKTSHEEMKTEQFKI